MVSSLSWNEAACRRICLSSSGELCRVYDFEMNLAPICQAVIILKFDCFEKGRKLGFVKGRRGSLDPFFRAIQPWETTETLGQVFICLCVSVVRFPQFPN